MLPFFISTVLSSVLPVIETSGNNFLNLLLISAVMGTGVVLSRRELRKAKRKLFWIAIKSMFRRNAGSGDNKGVLKVSLIVLGILLAAMMIHFLSWIGILLVLLILLPLLFLRKRRRRKY